MGARSNTSVGRRFGRSMLVGIVASSLVLVLVPAAGAGTRQPVSATDCQAAIRATAAGYESGRTPDPESEQLARDCTTPIEEGPIGESEVDTEEGFTGTSCRTIHDGYGYTNAFGQVFAAFVGHLRWCSNGNKVQGGEFWITTDRCCFWFYEGVVHTVNRGCFGGCDHVYRERKGSFIFNPPWPAVTTRVQPWFQLYGNKYGGSWRNSGG